MSILFQETEDAGPAEIGDAECLRDGVQRALKAADDFEGEDASAAVGELLKYDFGERVNALLNDAKTALDDFDFNTAVDLLEKALEE
jgi:hypothetical protein